MSHARVRMIDVAKAAGVSRTTASFVLNNKDEGIPEETRRRVVEAAERLEYRPHAGAQALATGRTNRIGLVLIDPVCFQPGDGYFTALVNGILEGSVRNDRNLLLHSAHYPDLRALEADILSGSTDGVILVGRSDDDELTRTLLDSGFPVICISYQVDRADCWSVDCDNEQGGRLAAEHLLSLGHRRIAFFGPGATSWGDARLAGVHAAVTAAGLAADSLYVFPWNEAATDAEKRVWLTEAADFLSAEKPRPTALICSDEARARQLLETLRTLGIEVPRDLAVVSFNSTETSMRTVPALTSVWQPLREIGTSSVDRLVQRISGAKPEPRTMRFPMRLDVRSSTADFARDDV